MNGEVDPSAWRQAAERLKQAMRIGCAGAVLAVAGVACVDAPDAPPPPCIEATPSPELGKLKETVNTAMETTLDYWEHYEGIEATLDVKPPQFFEEGDEKCTTPDDIVIGGPAYALASNQMYLRSTKDIDLNDPVVAVAATAHEMGHALQEKEEQPYHPESKEDKLAYSIVHEVRADCLGGHVMGAAYPEYVEEAAEFFYEIGAEESSDPELKGNHGTKEQRSESFEVGVREATAPPEESVIGITCDVLRIGEEDVWQGRFAA